MDKTQADALMLASLHEVGTAMLLVIGICVAVGVLLAIASSFDW